MTLRHPLYVKKDEERQEVLREYFLFFWRRHNETFAKSSQGLTYPADRFLLMPQEDTGRSANALDILAERFMTTLASPFLPLISIRSLDTMVKRLFHKTQIYFQRNPYVPQVTQARDFTASLSGQFERWVVELRNELVPEFDPEALLRQRGIF